MWLELSTTNNDPRVILLHYLTAVSMYKVCAIAVIACTGNVIGQA